MSQIYLAGPFFSDEQIDRVKRIEAALDSNPTVTDYYSPRKHQKTENPEFTSPWAAEVFQRDIKNVTDAGIIFSIIDYRDDDADSGTAFEQGMAWVQKKPIIVFNELKFPVNLMLSESLTAYITNSDDIVTYDFDQTPKLPFTGELF
ncbi:nucleoside 2-deoxyribosyltransferase [Leuconostoc mesenteroides P45]|uniref:nucleoside 2-deoxyribosyltransferase n=1 Tax=Leuconostoc mesenteroides TaxID=1245 RepID=UPI00050788D3|nr:nucleoside 2-deoxyribosyltransferase [Leuconostoc mesenteroides]KGB50305.1 nucleoside 2-deoxyribosyltransferase [Leuconostoc mesenteroides P45]